MSVLTLSESDERARLDHARDWLVTELPDVSSKRLLSSRQRVIGLVVLAVVVLALILEPIQTAIGLVAILTAIYVVVLVTRVNMVVRSLRQPNLVEVSDADAAAVSSDQLPVYTVLVPLYREAAVVPQLMASLAALDYPRERLDIKLIVEKDDVETLAALSQQGGIDFDTVVVPGGEPRTKPRALNYALTFARGELVTIFDAEDRPDPLQLRKAALAFSRLPSEVGCLQAQLAYWNDRQNIITRLFAIEYLQWFRLFLPGLASSGAPVPLGGTSNHVRRETLEAVGAWDPYNVTEDADLGIRMHRAGLRCAVLDSSTLEEANSDYVNWNNQRSRWYKGYLQTWLVHMRHPRRLLEQLGWRGWLDFNLFVGGTPVLSLVNMVFWALTVVWFSTHAGLVKELFPPVVYYPALFSFVLGNLVVAYLYMISARLSNQLSLVWASLLVPLYWLMMGVAALKALWQLAVSRSFWEKTVHGLTGDQGRVSTASAYKGNQSAPVTEFTGASAPALAARLQAHGPQIDGRRRERSLLARALQVTGLALLAFALYVFVLGGTILGFSPPREVSSSPLAVHPLSGVVIGSLVAREAQLNLKIVEGATSQTSGGVAGHVSSSAMPGASGDAVIVAHRLAFGGPFERLNRLRIGDEVTIGIGGGTAHYEVTSEINTGSRRLAVAPSSRSRLTLVTSGGGLWRGSLLVVQARLVSETGIPSTHPRAPTARWVVVPGASVGWLASAGLWAAVAIAAAVVGRRVWWRWNRLWTLLVVSPVVVVALCEACLAGGHALPPTV